MKCEGFRRHDLQACQSTVVESLVRVVFAICRDLHDQISSQSGHPSSIVILHHLHLDGLSFAKEGNQRDTTSILQANDLEQVVAFITKLQTLFRSLATENVHGVDCVVFLHTEEAVIDALRVSPYVRKVSKMSGEGRPLTIDFGILNQQSIDNNLPLVLKHARRNVVDLVGVSRRFILCGWAQEKQQVSSFVTDGIADPVTRWWNHQVEGKSTSNTTTNQIPMCVAHWQSSLWPPVRRHPRFAQLRSSDWFDRAHAAATSLDVSKNAVPNDPVLYSRWRHCSHKRIRDLSRHTKSARPFDGASCSAIGLTLLLPRGGGGGGGGGGVKGGPPPPPPPPRWCRGGGGGGAWTYSTWALWSHNVSVLGGFNLVSHTHFVEGANHRSPRFRFHAHHRDWSAERRRGLDGRSRSHPDATPRTRNKDVRTTAGFNSSSSSSRDEASSSHGVASSSVSKNNNTTNTNTMLRPETKHVRANVPPLFALALLSLAGQGASAVASRLLHALTKQPSDRQLPNPNPNPLPLTLTEP
jgi:hypothetical protein